MMKHEAFLHIAGLLNANLQIIPLLFGSLGLKKRLHMDLHADDIDILLPGSFLTVGWDKLVSLMAADGYTLFDAEEHAFKKAGLCAAFADIEGLTPFAGIDLQQIPLLTENGVRYYLLTLADYLKVYEASAKDGYRKNIKHKQDQQKIDLIKKALSCLPLTLKSFEEDDLLFLSGTGYVSMSEKAKKDMLAASQTRRHTDGNYFEMFSLRDGIDIIGFVSLYSKEPGSVSIGLDIREQYRRRGYGTRFAELIAKLLAEKGFSFIRNTVRTDNKASVLLHEKLGFTLTDQYTTDKGRNVYVFEKAIPENQQFIGKA